MVLLTISFITDYKTIMGRINTDIDIKVRQLESDYTLNNCGAKGHLKALKSECDNLQNQIEIYSKVSTLYIIYRIKCHLYQYL